VSHSSLHSQNEALEEFLGEEPDIPKAIPWTNDSFLSTIRLNRASLTKKALAPVVSKPDMLEEHLLQSTLSLTDHHLCSVPRSSPFILRTLSILFRQLLCGNGDADLVWANPASLIPLRIHSFASILHLLGGTCLYLANNGVTEVDGVRKWNMVTLGRVVALLFDERKLFGELAVEDIEEKYWVELLNPTKKKVESAKNRKSPRKGRHVRNTFELSDVNEIQPREELGDRDLLSSLAGELAGPKRGKRAPSTTRSENAFGSSLMPFSPFSAEFAKTSGGPSPEEITTEKTSIEGTSSRKSDFKIDSKSDFQSALRAVQADSEEDVDRVERDSTRAADAMMQGFTGLPNKSSRSKFFTMPAVRSGGLGLAVIREQAGLSTIEESEDGDDSDAFTGEGLGLLPQFRGTEVPSKEQKDPFDNSAAIQNLKQGRKQFRIPNINKEKKEEPEVEKKEEITTETEASAPPVPSVVPNSDEEIETAGLPFLDVIGQSLGLGYVYCSVCITLVS
jgi:hypothetical protein